MYCIYYSHKEKESDREIPLTVYRLYIEQHQLMEYIYTLYNVLCI